MRENLPGLQSANPETASEDDALTDNMLMQSFAYKQSSVSAVALLALTLAACQPTVKVEAPDKPIVINLNIKIEQEVRVKIDRELDEAFEENPSIFD